MSRQKALAMVGLAAKAGRVVSGEFAVEKSLKQGKTALVIIAGDASENTKKKFRNMCSYRNVPIYFFSDKSELGRTVGKENRSSLAIVDENFAAAVTKQLTDVEESVANGENKGL